jgi:iron complex transport system permease protein
MSDEGRGKRDDEKERRSEAEDRREAADSVHRTPDFRVYTTFAILIILLIASIILSLSYGHSLHATFSAFFGDDGFSLILKRIRIPRTIIAFLVGGSLGICGVTLQSILRNPLAEPFTLGISGGASFGVTLSAMAGMEYYLGMYANPASGFAGAMCAVFFVYILSKRRFFNPDSMVLFGIVVGLVFSSCVFFLFSLLDPDRMQITLMWLMGDLSTLDISLVPAYIPMFLIPAFILFFYGKELDVLSLGSEKALYLGVDPPRMYRLLFLLTSLLTGLSVSASGIIGFVGLIVPHLLRGILGASHTVLLFASYLAGAFFLILSDLVSRYLLYPVELPAGVITGIFGGVTLVFLLVRRS